MSLKHHQPATMHCPGCSCQCTFISHSALMLHLESGACRSCMTREKLNHLICADMNNYIMNPTHLLAGTMGHFEPLTCTVMWVTGCSWNRVAYKYFLCNLMFKTLKCLNLHLQSLCHKNKIYQCPNPNATPSLSCSVGCVSTLRVGLVA